MFYLLLAAVARVYGLFQRYAPSNRLLTWLRRRENLKWGVPFMLLGVVYLLLAATMTAWARNGGPGWANPVLLWGLCNAMKFLAFGPWSLLLLATARVRESLKRQRMRRLACAGVVIDATPISR